MKKYLAYSLALIILLPALAGANTLTVGVAPQRSTTQLAIQWAPVLAYASEKSGLRLRFATAPDTATFEERLGEGKYDIAYMNPYQYTVFSESTGYAAFVREQSEKGAGVVVVHKDSPVQSLSDLVGENLAFPSRSAFFESVLPRAQLAAESIDYSTAFVESQESVYLCVSHGMFAAGGGALASLQDASPSVRNNLRVLWSTEEFSPHAIAAHPRVSSDIVARVQRVLLNMNDDPRGQDLLKSINFSGVRVAVNEDWDAVRELGSEKLRELIN